MGAWGAFKKLLPSSASDNSPSDKEGKNEFLNFPIKGTIEEVFIEACKNNDREKALKCISIMEKEGKLDNVIIALEHYSKTFGKDLCDIEERIADAYYKKGDIKSALQHYVYSKVRGKGNGVEKKIYLCCKELIKVGGNGEAPSYWYNLYKSLFGERGIYLRKLKSLL